VAITKRDVSNDGENSKMALMKRDQSASPDACLVPPLYMTTTASTMTKLRVAAGGHDGRKRQRANEGVGISALIDACATLDGGVGDEDGGGSGGGCSVQAPLNASHNACLMPPLYLVRPTHIPPLCHYPVMRNLAHVYSLSMMFALP
jgi:hypothetical protein